MPSGTAASCRASALLACMSNSCAATWSSSRRVSMDNMAAATADPASSLLTGRECAGAGPLLARGLAPLLALPPGSPASGSAAARAAASCRPRWRHRCRRLASWRASCWCRPTACAARRPYAAACARANGDSVALWCWAACSRVASETALASSSAITMACCLLSCSKLSFLRAQARGAGCSNSGSRTVMQGHVLGTSKLPHLTNRCSCAACCAITVASCRSLSAASCAAVSRTHA